MRTLWCWASITCHMSYQISRPGLPSALGCLEARMGRYASLYKR